jgi:uncharacterized protein YbjT (DUF2867 family)
MPKENSKILISAASGKVGQHVVTQLAQKKVSARAGVHSQAKASTLRETGVDAAVLDFESPESIAAAFKGIDTLFLVTPGSPDQGRYEDNLLAEAKRVGVKRIVKLSGKIAEHHTVSFSRWNRDAERRIKESGISYTILRANYFMQNLFGNAEQINKALSPTARPPSASRSSMRGTSRPWLSLLSPSRGMPETLTTSMAQNCLTAQRRRPLFPVCSVGRSDTKTCRWMNSLSN